MLNFCTLFDSNYLSRGLLLYDSLERNINEFHLYIFAFDRLTFDILRRLSLENVTVISLEEFENEKLVEAKKTRSGAEYCWTSTSSTIDYVLENYKVPACTYLDADLFFYGSPEVLLDELKNGKNVLITEHRFSNFAKLFEQKRAGRFCVQFITFADRDDSRKILKTWKDQCIDWCYARYEDGKFGDQKYLEKWPEQYENVHVLEHQGGGIAPWNARQFHFIRENDKLYGIKSGSGERFEIIFFHFHYIRLLQSGFADLGWNRLPEKVKVLFYKPYISRMIEKEIFLEDKFSEYKRPVFSESTTGIKESAKSWFKRITHFNLMNVSKY
jgi:hypothetical protein